ncbi:S8 family serine peptidase [Kitasatospora sp. NPDC059673]|uniref:S8 family serine peptidase n=1 Tax=Kitasatospora sp. NPDC059673 TaxID=3346901 RepID=UPI0036BD5994
MTTSRSVRGLAAFAAGTLLWGVATEPAAADWVRDGQWALKNYRAAEKVWPISRGEGVIVAVIDSGVDADHPDLTGQVLPGLDLTGAGTDARNDTDGHGTGMASNIAAHGHGDNEGAMGLAPKAKILPIKIDWTSGAKDSSAADIAKAIRFAVDNNAKVINMSFGGGASTGDGYKEAINYAIQKDVVLVASSGNTAGIPVENPGCFPGVVAVSGVAESGDMWEKSTTGPQVTVAAPAVNIYHANQKKGYSAGDGTSDAAAYVSGIAALVRSKYPNLSAGQVINRIIKSTAKPDGKGSFPNDQYGYGIASPGGALAANPQVDNGPKENPLLKRATCSDQPASTTSASPGTGASDPAQAPPAGNGATSPQASSDSKSSNGMLIAVGGGVLALVVIVVIVLLVRRSKGGNGGGPGGSAGPGGPGGGPGYGYPPQQPGGYGQPQPGQGYPPQPPYPQQQAPYPPQQPPAGGNPYQR